MKKLEITIGKDGIKVIGDGQELITQKTISIVMEGEDEQPTPEPEPEPEPDAGVVYYDDFKSFEPQVSHTRLKEPTRDWAALENVAENKKSINLRANAVTDGEVLSLAVRKQTAKYGSTEKPFTSACVYSKKLFGAGRLDVRANLNNSRETKNSIWATTSPMVEPGTGIKYLYEFDVVEYTPAQTGDKNTSRGMWAWQENQQSVSKDALPYVDLATKTSYAGGAWYWVKSENGWRQDNLYPIYKNGNRLKGTNGKYYFITNTERGVAIPSQDLTWIREDGVAGKGLDGNKYFVVTDRAAIGGGSVTTQFLTGDEPISGWHVWSLIIDADYIAYECDGREYWRINNSALDIFKIQSGMTYNVIFAASMIQGEPQYKEMQVDFIRWIPKAEESK